MSIVSSKLDPLIISNANIIRDNNHKDYLDCLITGTAIRLGAIFATEDRAIKPIVEDIEEFRNYQT